MSDTSSVLPETISYLKYELTHLILGICNSRYRWKLHGCGEKLKNNFLTNKKYLLSENCT